MYFFSCEPRKVGATYIYKLVLLQAQRTCLRSWCRSIRICCDESTTLEELLLKRWYHVRKLFINCRRKKYTPKPSETKTYYTRNELSPMLENWHPGFGQCYAATRCGPRWNSVGDVNQRNPLDLQSAKSTQWSTICYRLLDACWFPRTLGTSWDHHLFTCHPGPTYLAAWDHDRWIDINVCTIYIRLHTTYLYHKISSTGTYCGYYRSEKKSDIFWYAKRKIHRKLNHHYCHILPLPLLSHIATTSIITSLFHDYIGPGHQPTSTRHATRFDDGLRHQKGPWEICCERTKWPIEIDDFPSYKPPFIRDFPWLCSITRWYIQYHSLVGGWPTPLKNMSQLGWLFPIFGKIQNVPNHQPDSVLSDVKHVWKVWETAESFKSVAAQSGDPKTSGCGKITSDCVKRDDTCVCKRI